MILFWLMRWMKSPGSTDCGWSDESKWGNEWRDCPLSPASFVPDESDGLPGVNRAQDEEVVCESLVMSALRRSVEV
jgi:hypothetical protein